MSSKFTFLPKGTILLFCVIFNFSSVVLKANVIAPPLFVVEEGSAPEINLAFSYGTENDPVPASSSLSMVYAYQGYSIDEAESNITIDLANSWYGDASEISVYYNIDHEAREISVTLTRNDLEEIEGFGFAVRLKGIIVVVDDILRTKKPEKDFTVSAYFSNDTETLLMKLDKDFGPLKFSLYNLGGSLIAQKQISGGVQAKWRLPRIPSQVYVLEMANETMVMRKKIVIGR